MLKLVNQILIWRRTYSLLHYSTNFNVEEEQIQNFQNLSQKWWNENGEFKPLHSLNRLRIPFIRDRLVMTTINRTPIINPLQGFKLLDIGCGGGILCEPLARLGATVVGLDPVEENIDAANRHLSLDKSIQSNLKYIVGTAEHLLEIEAGTFDAVIASEVIEHVGNPYVFAKTCCDLVKPGGFLFFTTLSRTWKSYFLGVLIAEYVLWLVPKGIHSWKKFITPEELVFMLDSNHCRVELIHGMMYNPLTNYWTWCQDKTVNYALQAVKIGEPGVK